MNNFSYPCKLDVAISLKRLSEIRRISQACYSNLGQALGLVIVLIYKLYVGGFVPRNFWFRTIDQCRNLTLLLMPTICHTNDLTTRSRLWMFHRWKKASKLHWRSIRMPLEVRYLSHFSGAYIYRSFYTPVRVRLQCDRVGTTSERQAG